MRIVFNTLEGSYALCLVANIIQLGYIEIHGALQTLCFPTFTVRVITLLCHLNQLEKPFLKPSKYVFNRLSSLYDTTKFNVEFSKSLFIVRMLIVYCGVHYTIICDYGAVYSVTLYQTINV